MVIQLPEWDGWRIEGCETDWQIQALTKDKSKKGGIYWKGTNFFSSLEAAIGFAYERALRESGTVAESFEGAQAECKRVKAALVREVKKAVG